jgi:hypothetical protein
MIRSCKHHDESRFKVSHWHSDYCDNTMGRPQEDVYIYRVNGPLRNLRRVFLDYLKSMNDLRERPSYYNTLIVPPPVTAHAKTNLPSLSRISPWPSLEEGMFSGPIFSSSSMTWP